MVPTRDPLRVTLDEIRRVLPEANLQQGSALWRMAREAVDTGANVLEWLQASRALREPSIHVPRRASNRHVAPQGSLRDPRNTLRRMFEYHYMTNPIAETVLGMHTRLPVSESVFRREYEGLLPDAPADTPVRNPPDTYAQVRHAMFVQQADEDARVFEAMDQVTQEGWTAPNLESHGRRQLQAAIDWDIDCDILHDIVQQSPPTAAGGQMEEAEGIGMVHTSVARRTYMGFIDIPERPEIRAQEGPRERFVPRSLDPVTVPPLPPPKPMSINEMEKVALVIRRSVWERLRDDALDI